MSIRWDAVVDCAAALSCNAPPPRHCLAAPAKEQGRIAVQVRMFGALAAISAEPTIECELSSSTTLADVFAFLGERLGGEFLAHVLDPSGSKHRHCRLFMDGYPVEDLRTPLASTAGPNEIDIILLVAPEGG